MARGKITDKWSAYFMYSFANTGKILEAYTVSHRWYFATNQIQCLVFQTVTTQRDAQRPAVF